MTLRKNVFTDSAVGNTSATSGARTTAIVSFNRAAYGFGLALDQSSLYSAGISSSEARLRWLGVFFIFATFTGRGFSCADDSNSVDPLGEDYQKQSPCSRVADDQQPLFLPAIRRIGQDRRQQVSEERGGLVKRDAMLSKMALH